MYAQTTVHNIINYCALYLYGVILSFQVCGLHAVDLTVDQVTMLLVFNFSWM